MGSSLKQIRIYHSQGYVNVVVLNLKMELSLISMLCTCGVTKGELVCVVDHGAASLFRDEFGRTDGRTDQGHLCWVVRVCGG